VAGIKWSGAAKSRSAARAIKIATIEDGVAEIIDGLDRSETVDFINALGDRSGQATVGIDFGFGLPAWYCREGGFDKASDVWAYMAQLAETHGDESQWPREHLGFPFWGPNIRPRPNLSRRDMWFRSTEEIVRNTTGMPPQSTFRLAGQGSIGSQSVRGMPHLLDLRDHGWSIWPFDEPDRKTVVEVFPSAYRVVAQTKWLKSYAEADLISLMDSELDLDSSVRYELEREGRVVSALLAAWLIWRDTEPLPDLSDDGLAQIEGRIWLPSSDL
jgi:hypothetical protein